MSARLIRFPSRPKPPAPHRWEPFAVSVMREELGGWLVVCRDHGWVHGSRREALRDAYEVADGWGVGVVIRLCA